MDNCSIANAEDDSILVQHQKHRLPGSALLPDGRKVSVGGFLCSDVIAMEVSHGRHVEGCMQVGYIGARACCVLA